MKTMLMTALLGTAFLATACGKGAGDVKPTLEAADVVAVAAAGETPVEAPPQKVEAPQKALGKKFGFVYTANVMGELEPCG